MYLYILSFLFSIVSVNIFLQVLRNYSSDFFAQDKDSRRFHHGHEFSVRKTFDLVPVNYQQGQMT